MTDVKKVIEHLDHHTPEFAEDPWSVYRVMREQCPVQHSDAYEGFWAVTRYQDVIEVSRNDDTFSSASGITIPHARPESVKNIPIDLDPPEFWQHRKLINPLFSPLSAKRVEPDIRALTTELLDNVIEAGSCDIHHALCRPLPAVMTFRLLGFPTESGEWKDYLDVLEYGPGAVSEQARRDSVRRMDLLRGVIEATIESRRSEPKNDWVSFLVQAEIEGRRLTQEEILGYINLILAGGLLTTTDAIGNALVYLEQDREARRRLIEGPPALWDTAIEEFLRYEAPVTALCRTATRDTSIDGKQIKAGEKVLMFWASANRDPEEFPEPDRVILDRHPNRHVSFGVGIHRCLGSNLGRLEFRVALEEVLRRMPDYRIDLAALEPSRDVGTTFGRLGIPMTFTPGRREGAGRTA